MAQWVLKSNGNVVPRRTLRPLQVDKLHNATEAKKREVFDGLIERRWGTSITPPIVDTTSDDEHWEEYEDDDEVARIVPEIEDSVDSTGRLFNQQPAYNKLIHAEVQLQKGNDISHAKVTQRALGPDGTVAGRYDENPMLNSIVYEVEFPDGEVKEYAANTIPKICSLK